MSDSVSVPDVLDETTADAQRALAAVGLTLGTISTEKNPGGIPGTVLRTSPDTGSSVPQGSAIDLVIIEAAPNSGVDLVIAEEAELAAMPNVIGQELKPVLDFLLERGHPVDVDLKGSEPTGDEASVSASQRKLDLEHDVYVIWYQYPEAGYHFRDFEHGPQSAHIKLTVDDRGPPP